MAWPLEFQIVSGVLSAPCVSSTSSIAPEKTLPRSPNRLTCTMSQNPHPARAKVALKASRLGALFLDDAATLLFAFRKANTVILSAIAGRLRCPRANGKTPWLEAGRDPADPN